MFEGFKRKRSRRSDRIRKALISAVTAVSIFAGTAAYFGVHTASLAQGEVQCDVREPQTAGMNGRTVILHSNDVHGAIDGYSKMAWLKSQYEAAGAEVVLCDTGGYTPVEPEYNDYRTLDAMTMMFYAGYKVAGIGDSEIRGGYDEFRKAVSSSKFRLISTNSMKDGKTILTPGYLHEAGSGVKIGFISIGGTEDAADVTFLSGDDMYAAATSQVDSLKKSGADLVIALAQTGDSGACDLYSKVKDIDMILGGHSNAAMTEGSKGEPVQAAGERFAYIGVVVVDGEGNIADHYLVETDKLGSDSKVTESSARILERVGDTPAIGSAAMAATSKAGAKASAKAGEGASAEATTEEAVKAATEAVIEAATEAAESKKAATAAAETKKAATEATESKKAAGSTDTKAEPVKEETEAKAEDTKKEETKADDKQAEAEKKEETKAKAEDTKKEETKAEAEDTKKEEAKADDKQTEAAKKEDTKAEEKKDDAGDDSVGNNDGEYEVVKGDCLWNIARDRLGDGTRWVEIYELNKGIISNPSLIYVGQQLVLPPG